MNHWLFCGALACEVAANSVQSRCVIVKDKNPSVSQVWCQLKKLGALCILFSRPFCHHKLPLLFPWLCCGVTTHEKAGNQETKHIYCLRLIRFVGITLAVMRIIDRSASN